jgi:hypothetical protein
VKSRRSNTRIPSSPSRRFACWGDLGVAWRYLDYDLQSDGPIQELNFNGPGVGVSFRW